MQTQMIRTSERKTFKRCPQQWWWAWQEGLVLGDPSKALWFGTLWHMVMADYYKKGTKRSKDYIDLWRHLCNTPDAEGMFQAVDDMGEEWVDLRELGEIMLRGYVEHWGGDKDWDVIQTEYSGQVLIPRIDGKPGKIQYNFTFDGVYREKSTRKIKLMEHKTAAAIGALNYLSLDDQGGSYWAVAPTILRSKGILGEREKIHGITYNFARKGKPDGRPRNQDGYVTNKPTKANYLEVFAKAGLHVKPSSRIEVLAELAEKHKLTVYGEVSKNQPAPLFVRHNVIRTSRERKTQIERIQAEAAHMSAMQDGDMPLYKSPDQLACAGCAFREMCEMHEARSDWSEFKRTVYQVVDRYSDHRDRKVS